MRTEVTDPKAKQLFEAFRWIPGAKFERGFVKHWWGEGGEHVVTAELHDDDNTYEFRHEDFDELCRRIEQFSQAYGLVLAYRK